jgi:hypothetical protein
MKKFIFSLSILALLFSGYTRAEENTETLEICKKEAQLDEIAEDLIEDYIKKCVADVEGDEEKSDQ